MLLTASAPGLEWDADPTTPGIQGGNGDWDSGNVWWDGSKNISWTSGESAIFGGTPGAVDAGGITVKDITFNSNYTLQQGASSGPLNLTFGTVTVAEAGMESHISASINYGSLTKAGAGTLTLSGKNTSLNSTRIREGQLNVSGGQAIPDTSDLFIDSGAILQLLDSERIRSLGGAGNVALGQYTLAIGYGSNGFNTSFSGTITGSGAIDYSGSKTLTLLSFNSTFSGGVRISDGTLFVPELRNVGEASPLGIGGNITLNGGTLTVGLGKSDRPVIIEGEKGTISATAAVTLTGPISGSHLVKTGTGSLVLENGSNTFRGITVNEGILSVPSLTNKGVPGYLGAGDSIAFVTNGALRITGAGNHSFDRTLIIESTTGGIILPAGTSLTQEIANVRGSYGTLYKSGEGTLILNGASSNFAGNILIKGGVLQTSVLADSGIASGLGAGKEILFERESGSQLSGELFVPVPVNSATNRVIRVGFGGGRIRIAGGTMTLTGHIFLDGPLTLTGNSAEDSTFIISSPSTSYTSGVISLERVKVRVADYGIPDNVRIELAENQGGWLVIDRSETVGSLSGGGGANFGRITLSDVLFTGGDNSSFTFTGLIEGSGSVTKQGTGTFTLAGANTFTGSFKIDAGTVSVPSVENAGIAGPLGAGGIVQLGNYSQFVNKPVFRFSGTASDTTNRTLLINLGGGSIDVSSATGTLIWSGQINGDASAKLTKEGPGTLRITGANGFTGAVDIRNGRLQIIGGNALPNAGNVNVEAGATLELLPGGSETIGGLQGAGNLSLGGQRLITGENNLSTTFSGKITGNSSSQLIKRGSGTFTLANIDNSDFSGAISISDGAISVPSLGSNGAITLGDNEHIGRLVLTNTGEIETNRPFFVSSGGGAIDVANQGAEVAFLGPIEGTGSLLKLGSGRLRIAGDKNYGGTVVVGDGILDLDGNLPSPMTVLAPASLESSGASARTIGALTLAGGTLSPGGAATAATLNTSNLILDSGTFEFNAKGPLLGYDHINATGSVFLNGIITLSIELGVDPVDFVDVYRLVVNDGTDPTLLGSENGRFAYQGNVLEEGEIFLVTSGDQSQLFEMRYGLTSEDNDVRLVAAPEPGSVSLLSCGMLCLASRRRRKRPSSLGR